MMSRVAMSNPGYPVLPPVPGYALWVPVRHWLACLDQREFGIARAVPDSRRSRHARRALLARRTFLTGLALGADPRTCWDCPGPARLSPWWRCRCAVHPG